MQNKLVWHFVPFAVSVIAESALAQDAMVDLEFALPPVSDSDVSRSLDAIVRVQSSGGTCPNGLYLMTHFGDREDPFEQENRSMIDNPLLERTWRFCSVFSMIYGKDVTMGRNWDNESVGSIIISL
jgi:hypothetical protein